MGYFGNYFGSGGVQTSSALQQIRDIMNAPPSGSAPVANPQSVATVANAGSGGGISGPSSLTLNYQDSSGVMVPGVAFTIVGQGSALANASGGAAVGVNNGTYTLVSRSTNSIIFPSTQITVNGTTSVTVTGAAQMLPTPTIPGAVIGTTVATDGSGNPQSGIVFYFTLDQDGSNEVISAGLSSFTATSDSNGLAHAQFVPGRSYFGQRGKDLTSRRIPILTPSSNFTLPAMLGT